VVEEDGGKESSSEDTFSGEDNTGSQDYDAMKEEDEDFLDDSSRFVKMEHSQSTKRPANSEATSGVHSKTKASKPGQQPPLKKAKTSKPASSKKKKLPLAVGEKQSTLNNAFHVLSTKRKDLI